MPLLDWPADMSVKSDHQHVPGHVWKSEADVNRLIQERRKLEDQDIERQFTVRFEQLRAKLVDMYGRKHEMQTQLEALLHSIKLHEQDQDRLAKDWDSTIHNVTSRREAEDQHRQRMLQLERERNATPNGGARMRALNNGHHHSERERSTHSPASAGGWTSINGSRGRKSASRDDDDELPTDPGNLLARNYHAAADGNEPNGRPGAYKTNGADMDVDDSDAGLAVRTRTLMPKQEHQQQSQARHSLPGFHSETRRESPVDPKGRSPSGRRSLPGARSQSQASEASSPVDQTEINRETLVLKHNGTVYMEPEMFKGVPVGRIAPGDGYWEEEWQPLEDLIKPQLEQWQEKLDKLRRDNSAVRHTVFLANRQVNRGQAIIDYLAGSEPEFHPYQFVGKEWMHKFYKTFVNYDTMFRLINIHEELKKFDLDITPLDWLRQRIWEVSEAQGDKFNLSKYTHDLYHDSKLKLLREKHGFGNIGRPSGYKVGEKNPDKGKAKLKREQLGISGRRKNRRSISQVDMDDTQSLDGYPLLQQQRHLQAQQQRQLPGPEFLDPITPHLQKRPRLEGGLPGMANLTMMNMPAPERAPMLTSMPAPVAAPPSSAAPTPPQVPSPAPEADDLEYDGWTSSDSFSAGRISVQDFRIHQIKTGQMTTSTEVTQYWTWKPESQVFEHQVLRDVHPKVTWGYYQKPINFDVPLAELAEVHYATDNLKISVSLKDPTRGDILAHFKRQRTKNRFLASLRKRGAKVTKVSPAQLEDAWDSMKSETLLGDE